jgi:hypothetical protein
VEEEVFRRGGTGSVEETTVEVAVERLDIVDDSFTFTTAAGESG